MPLDDSTISHVRAVRSGGDLLVTWDSTAPAGTVFQVYVDRTPVKHGTSRSVRVPVPERVSGSVDVFAVAASEASTDFSASIPPPPGGGDRARLRWTGGTYLGDDIESFRVYSSPSPGAAVDTARPVAEVTAYDQDQVIDGFGVGGFGDGGFGTAAGEYLWQSGPLAPGVWHFNVVSVDTAGNESAPWSSTVTVAAPPGPPSLDALGRRVTGTYAPSTSTLALAWNPP